MMTSFANSGITSICWKRRILPPKPRMSDERRHYFGNYLVDSRNFLRNYPDAPPRLWVLRAIAAVQLNKEATGKEAGHMILTALPEKDRSDPHIQTLLVILARHGLARAQSRRQGWRGAGSDSGRRDEVSGLNLGRLQAGFGRTKASPRRTGPLMAVTRPAV